MYFFSNKNDKDKRYFKIVHVVVLIMFKEYIITYLVKKNLNNINKNVLILIILNILIIETLFLCYTCVYQLLQ